MHPNIAIKNLSYLPASRVLKSLPPDFPILFLGGGGDVEILAISFYEVSWRDFIGLEPTRMNSYPQQAFAFSAGYMGVVSYDQFQAEALPGRKPSRVFRVNQSLVFNKKDKKLCYVKAKDDFFKLKALGATYELPMSFFMNLIKSCNTKASQKKMGPLRPRESDESYLAKCQSAIEEIKNGRFYQINLLRYFDLDGDLTRSTAIARFERFSGPFGAYFDVGDLSLVSFSPEQFIELLPGRKIQIVSKPIKGTSPRARSAATDLRRRENLQTSVKDQCELHMIVDLMRNDLQKISFAGSVVVYERGKVNSFKNVHHLIADIRSDLLPEISIGELMRCLCPCGSITGAPKIEVMKAIFSYEQRNRGYFMGNVFYWDDGGHFNSSVLIRTLVKGQKNWEYAAGSGIVLQSKPYDEMQEIKTKCRVLTDP